MTQQPASSRVLILSSLVIALSAGMRCAHEINEGDVIAIDGKTLRGSYTRNDRQVTIHRVNAFYPLMNLPLPSHNGRS
jgi:hypothetical protein